MQRISPPCQRFSRQRGISLLESLIALVISVLGIMGILGMQMRTLTDSQTATRRAQAIRLIEDLSERMHVLPNAMDGLARYATALETVISDFDDTPDPEDCVGSNASCQLFASELERWKESVSSLGRASPGQASVFQASVFIAPWEDPDAPTQIGVLVSWRANEGAGLNTDDIDATQVRVRQADGSVSNSFSNLPEDVECPEGRICHLQYITVAARCALYTDGRPYCPGSK